MSLPVSKSDIVAAADRIRPYVRETPLLECAVGSFGLDIPISLKLEFLQHTGSFKPRGAFNSLLSTDVPERGGCSGIRRQSWSGGGLCGKKLGS